MLAQGHWAIDHMGAYTDMRTCKTCWDDSMCQMDWLMLFGAGSPGDYWCGTMTMYCCIQQRFAQASTLWGTCSIMTCMLRDGLHQSMT